LHERAELQSAIVRRALAHFSLESARTLQLRLDKSADTRHYRSFIRDTRVEHGSRSNAIRARGFREIAGLFGPRAVRECAQRRLKNDATAGYISRSVRSRDILIVEQKLITVTPTAAARGRRGAVPRGLLVGVARERTRREISRVAPIRFVFPPVSSASIFLSPRPSDTGERKRSTCAREHLTVSATSANPS